MFVRSVGGDILVAFTDGSLNLNWRGQPVEVAKKNWKIIKSRLGLDRLQIAYLTQVHGAVIRVVEGSGYAGVGDGLVTSARGVALTVMVADCLPVVLADVQKRVICCLHCGWRSLSKGILSRACSILKSRYYADNLVAFLGPCAGSCCYEVGKEFVNFFPEKHLVRRSGRLFFDMRGFAEHLLVSCGVKIIDSVNECTICSGKYFSYRGGSYHGRQAAIVTICG